MSEKLIFNCTFGRDDPERATLPFIAANIAAVAGQEAIVLCTVDAVHLGTVDGTDGIEAPGLPRLADLFAEFVSNQGRGVALRSVHQAAWDHREPADRRCRDRRRGEGG